MKIEDCFQLGYVIKSHGLHGELSIFLDTDFPENYIEMESVYVEFQQKLVPFFVETINLMVQNAYMDSKALAISRFILADGVVEDILGKAQNQMLNVARSLSNESLDDELINAISNSSSATIVAEEVVETKKELTACRKELNQLKNSPELRFYNAQKLFLEGNLKSAKEDYQNILMSTSVESDSLIIAKKIEMIDSIIKSNNRNF